MPSNSGPHSQRIVNNTPFHPEPAFVHRYPTEEENIAQLQRAVHQNDNASADNNNNASRTGSSTPATPATPVTPATPATDGAGNPAAVGGDYTTLRLLTRRQPQNPESLLNGVDTSILDLSWTARQAPDGLDPNGQPWRYPKKRGKGEGSNLDQFKEDITERTKNGQGCKAIAEAFVAMGIDTSVRAVARQRMKWGLRQRAVRKMTEQGLANIRKAHLEHAKRMANSEPLPVKRVRIRVIRKAEITRMTKEGMSAAQIAENLTARGVKLSRGAATVERLRTVWGLTADTDRSIHNIRATARNQATKAQKDQFENIARELGIEDVDAWVRDKMEEEVAQDARREYAYKLMGSARPKPVPIEIIRSKSAQLKALRAEQTRQQREKRGNVLTRVPGVDYVPESHDMAYSPSQQQDGSSGPVAAPDSGVGESGAPVDIIEVSDDGGDTEDEDMDIVGDGVAEGVAAALFGTAVHNADVDGTGNPDHAHNGQQATPQFPEYVKTERPSTMDIGSPAPMPAPQVSQGEASQQPRAVMEVDENTPAPMHAPRIEPTTGVYLLGSHQPADRPPPPQPITDPINVTTGGPLDRPPPSQQITVGPTKVVVYKPYTVRYPHTEQPSPSEPLPRPPVYAASYASQPSPQFHSHFQPAPAAQPQFQPVQNSYGPQNATPAPPAGMPGRRPVSSTYTNIAPRPQPKPIAPALAPRDTEPQPLTAQQHPFHPQQKEIDHMAKFGLRPWPCPGKPPQKYLTPTGLVTTEGYEYLAAPPSTTPPGVPKAPPPPPPPGYEPPPTQFINAVPQPPMTWSVVPAPPPPSPPKLSQIPQPLLYITPEEMRRHTVEARILENYHKVSQECLDMLTARASGRPMPLSLTGLPPSLKDVQFAKERLREAANALLVEL